MDADGGTLSSVLMAPPFWEEKKKTNRIYASTNAKENKPNQSMKYFSARSQLGDMPLYQLHTLKLKVGQK